MEWVASTLHTTSERGASCITTADAHTSAASSRLNWRPRRCKWTSPFRRKTKSGFWACAITFQTHSTFVIVRTKWWSDGTEIAVRRLKLITRLCTWNSCWINWQWDTYLCGYFDFLLSITIPPMLCITNSQLFQKSILLLFFFYETTIQCGPSPPLWTSPSQLCFLTPISNL